MQHLHTLAKAPSVEALQSREDIMRLVNMAAAALAAGVSLIAWSAHAAGDLNMICSADPEVCDMMKGLFEKQSDIKVNMVRLSAGETYAKIRAEARNPKTDIWWA